MAQSDPMRPNELLQMCQEKRWGEALDAFLGRLPSRLLQEAWRQCVESEAHLLSQACRAAVQQGESQRLRHWYEVIVQTQPRLQARLGARRVTYAADMIRAAGLALTARTLAPVPGQPPALRALCAWFDGAVAQDELAETLTNRLGHRLTESPAIPASPLAPVPDPVARFDLLCLDTLCEVLADKAVL